jgi:hypothetical protein
MKTIKNITNEAQAVANMPAFAPGETRKVDDQTAEILSLSPHFEEVKGNADAKDKPKWGKEKASDLDD